MKKTIIRVTVCILVFLVATVIISRIMNMGNNNLTMEMAPASLPIVTMEKDGIAYNQLHGYRSAMDTAYQHETVTELGQSRETYFTVDTYGLTVKQVNVEVRSIDGTRLVENSKVTDISALEKNRLECSISLKDLMEADTEYMLVILLDTEEEGIIRYYTRIIWSDDTYALEKLQFVKEFHALLYDREAAKEQGLTKYLESDSTGDNTTFHKVNIHSSFKQITWGDLNVTEETEPVIQLTELGTQTGSIVLHYVVSTTEEKATTYYAVEEAYRVRFLTNAERMYLLEFERTMTQIPDVRGDIYSGDKILLGIVDENLPFVESEDGNIIVFRVAGRLCSYNVTTGKMTVLFSFYDSENADARTLYDHHDMEVLDVDEGGNVQFAVYGYMNRGRHEGEVGIAVYHYDNTLNTIEEIVYIPSQKSYDVLAEEMEQLLFLNREGQLYLYLENTVFQIDVNERTYDIITGITQDGSMMASENHKILAWQEGEDSYHGSRLVIRNLSSGKQSEIVAEDGTAVKLLGFMGEDIIYGIARLEEITTDAAGKVFFPMYEVCIYDDEEALFEKKAPENIFMTSCTVAENQITLERVQRTGDGVYEATTPDYVMINEEVKAGKNQLVVVSIDVYQKYVQIQTRLSIDEKNLQVRSPKEVVFEGGRDMELVAADPIERYYAYDTYGVCGIFTDPAQAVKLAYEESGVVTDDSGTRIWRRGNLVTRNQIMAIKENLSDETRSSLAVCLDTILKNEGITMNTQEFLNQGQTPVEILENGLEQCRILNLTGVSLDAMLYYVNQDIPVLAVLANGEAVLVTGFNEFNVVIMNPVTGELGKKGIKDSTQWFAENGNCFITYVYE